MAFDAIALPSTVICNFYHVSPCNSELCSPPSIELKACAWWYTLLTEVDSINP